MPTCRKKKSVCARQLRADRPRMLTCPSKSQLKNMVRAGSEIDGSGDGSPILSTITATPPPATRSLTADDHKPVLVTTSATESSFETKSTELNATNIQDSLEAAEQSILIYIVPAVLLVLLILLITFFVTHHKRKKSKQDELGSENVKSPIFEEDTPSVMEIEMEELDKWMNSMNKNADCECLPTVREEEKESIANPRVQDQKMYFGTITSCVVGGQSVVTQQFVTRVSSGDSHPTLLQPTQLRIQQPLPSRQRELKHSWDMKNGSPCLFLFYFNTCHRFLVISFYTQFISIF
ncbi:transmembrane protein 154 isoform 3-T3 [Morphnus guianensis]